MYVAWVKLRFFRRSVKMHGTESLSSQVMAGLSKEDKSAFSGLYLDLSQFFQVYEDCLVQADGVHLEAMNLLFSRYGTCEGNKGLCRRIISKYRKVKKKRTSPQTSPAQV